MSSCSNDRDSNPTFKQPSTFVLNETNWRGSIFELKTTTDSLQITWSQPDYTVENAPVVVTYNVDFSPKGTFTKAYDASAEDNTGADYTSFDAQTDCSLKLGAEQLNRVIQEICGYTSEADVPLYSLISAIRVRAAVLTATNEPQNPVTSNVVTSNVVNIKVMPYFMLLKAADPEIWYLLGSDIADGSWGDVIGEKCIPMQTIEDVTYNATTGQGKIQWIGYLAGGGFKIRGSLTDSWATQWGQGDAFGKFVKNDGGSGNITVPTAGVYKITLYTDADLAAKEGKPELSIEPYDGTVTVFDGMAIAGSLSKLDGYEAWSDLAMNPCSTAGENHDWYIVQEFNAGDEFKVKQAGSWDFNRGGEFVGYDEGSFYAYGVQNGANFVVPEPGSYMILFNDITGYVRFIKQKAE